ncbi:MAG: twin-arginine translocase subunit TatB [Epsilonproteobacteria bacterium]|nr:twin-arginine translocase subunit TatB [Campylobacterota bacterium]
MLDIGFSEFLVIVVLAILVLGPEKLPDALKDIARFIKKTKKMWRDATSDITKELEMEEMKEELKKYKDELKHLQDETKLPDINTPVDTFGSRDMKDFLKS